MNSRNRSHSRAAFTLVELLIATAASSVLAAAIMTTWTALATTAVNTTAYADRHNDQLRVLDYLKRDIRRATLIEVCEAGVPVTGSALGTELRLTLPDYYQDARDEDHAYGSREAFTPSLAAGVVSYGGTMTVRYFISAGAVLRQEGANTRVLGDREGGFALSFRREATGDVRFRIFYDQPLRGAGQIRRLRREVEAVCTPRVELQT